MKTLIRSALILSPKSPFHKKKKNVLIQNGRIEEIGDKNYLTLNQCGVYCRGQGFRIDVERFIEIRRRILAID